MKRVVLLHGNRGGSGEDNWFPWLKYRLEKLGVVCEAPDLPDPVEAKASVWLPYVKDVIKADEDTVLIGHSTGAAAAARYAEENKIGGLVLVGAHYAPDNGDDFKNSSDYLDNSWDWDAIKTNSPWIAVYASTDDPYIKIDEPRFVKEQLGAAYYEFTDRGHFGYDRDAGKFPELLEMLQEELSIS